MLSAFYRKSIPAAADEYTDERAAIDIPSSCADNNCTIGSVPLGGKLSPQNDYGTSELPLGTTLNFEIGEDSDRSSNDSELARHLTLMDLVAIGIGGTVGSGLFVLAGLVSHEYAGPSAVLSWGVAGLAALLSGACYAELAARIPLPGGAFSYAYVAMGELAAVLVAACLSLEYIASSAAVARSWGDKVVEWLTQEFGKQFWIQSLLGGFGSFSPMAFLISTGTVALLLGGVKESKQVTNLVTGLKVSLCLFMIIAGFVFVNPANWKPFIPAQFGAAGVLRGATGTFFGYLGYDQVCSLGGEAINPKQDLPTAIMFTLGFVTVLYMIATLVLTGMQPYQNISSVSGFPSAFYSLDADLCGQITALGEVLTLPIVVLITLMSQPRLQYAMAVDGLLPPFFKRLDAKGNLRNGTIVSGTIMIFIATFVPFKYLNDMISCAVLSVLSITDTSIILMWHEAPDPNSNLTEWLALAYNMACLITAIAATNFLGSLVGNLTFILSTASMALSAFGLYKLCPRARVFGGRRDRHARGAMRTDDGYFRTPFLPFLPCAAIFVNWYLIAQLEITGVVGLAAFLGLAAIYYFVYAIHHSAGSKAGWGQVDTTDEDNYVQFDAGAFSSGEGGRSGVAERINCKTIS